MRGYTHSYRLAKYLLRNWRYFDDNYTMLSEGQIDRMKELYNALKQLDDKTLHYLTIKYYIPRENITNGIYYLRDDVVANKLGIPYEQYKKNRIQAEMELQKHIMEARENEKLIKY